MLLLFAWWMSLWLSTRFRPLRARLETMGSMRLSLLLTVALAGEVQHGREGGKKTDTSRGN